MKFLTDFKMETTEEGKDETFEEKGINEEIEVYKVLTEIGSCDEELLFSVSDSSLMEKEYSILREHNYATLNTDKIIKKSMLLEDEKKNLDISISPKHVSTSNFKCILRHYDYYSSISQNSIFFFFINIFMSYFKCFNTFQHLTINISHTFFTLVLFDRICVIKFLKNQHFLSMH